MKFKFYYSKSIIGFGPLNVNGSDSKYWQATASNLENQQIHRIAINENRTDKLIKKVEELANQFQLI